MNDDRNSENRKKDEEKNGNEIKTNPQTEGNGRKRKYRYTGIFLICAVIFVAIYAIVNIGSISGFASGIVSVLTPIILGFAFAYLLNPILKLFEFRIFKWIKNKTLLRALSLICTYALALAFIVAILFLILPELVSSLSLFVTKFGTYIDETIADVNGWIADYFGTHDVPDIIKKEDILSAVSEFFTESGDLFQAIGSYIISYGTGFVIGLKNFVLAVFISIYVLISKERLFSNANKICTAILSPSAKERFYKYVKICDKTFGGFFVGKIIDSLIIGVITLVTLMIFDIPYGVLVSAIVCVTNIIPVFGPFIGAIPSFFIIFIVDPKKAFIFLILIIIVQQLDGNVIGPKILGNTTGLSSLGVIISIIVMGDWFGVIGMIVGVPIFAVAVTLINEFIENKLRKKNLPVNSAEYYSDNSLVDPYEERQTISQRLFSFAGRLFGKIMKVIFRKNKVENNTNSETKKEEKKND